MPSPGSAARDPENRLFGRADVRRAVAAALRKQQQDVTDFFKDPKGWQASWFRDPRAQELKFWLRS